VALRSDGQAALLAWAEALLNDEDLENAEARAGRALDLSAGDPRSEAEALLLIARAQLKSNNSALAARTLDDVEYRLEKLGPEPSVAKAWTIASRARLLVFADRHSDSIPAYEKAIRLAIDAQGPGSVAAIDMQLEAATSLVMTQQPERSVRFFESAIGSLRGLGGAHEVRAAFESARFAYVRRVGGRHGSTTQLLQTLQECIDTLAASKQPVAPWFIPQIRVWMGSSMVGYGDIDHGVRLIEDNVPVLKRYHDSPNQRYGLAEELAEALNLSGRHLEAKHWYEERIANVRSRYSADSPYLAFAYAYAAQNLARAGLNGEAEALLAKAPQTPLPREREGDPMQTLRDVRAMIHLSNGDTKAALSVLQSVTVDGDRSQCICDHELLGEALCRAGRRANGMGLLNAQLADQVAEQRRGNVYRHSPETARLYAVIGRCALDAGDRRTAQINASRARESFDAQPGVSPYFKQPLVDLERAIASW